MKGMNSVYRKEVRENLRDRRALFNSVLLGPLLFPVLFIGLAWFGASKQQERAEAILEVPVVGAEHAPNLVNFLTPFIDSESGKLAIDWEDELATGTCLTRDGKVVHSILTGA